MAEMAYGKSNATGADINIVRHSLAHIMAEAVRNLFPGTKIAIGPAIEDGFYYDFDFAAGVKFSDADFGAVEKEMRRILATNCAFIRKEVTREEALAIFADEPYKVDLIKALPDGEAISIYTSDTFTDLCRGPHVQTAHEINAQSFKLMKTAGAYWHGDSTKPMLTRVYAVCFSKPNELKDYLKRLEEAAKRDHRKIGVAMDLFHLESEDPGQIFWHPNGWTMYVALQNYMREKVIADGYKEVNTPAVMPRSLWEKSGHWAHYQTNMFITESEKRLFAIKPMNCPGALEIFNSRSRSYKELPLRLAEFGHCVRNEPSGTLHGIMRVRGFVQDDAHILCTEEQIEAEVAKFCRLLIDVYSDFGFDKGLIIKLSTMPDDHVGDEATWQHAETALMSACDAAGLKYEIQPKEGAFYGPKLEFTLTDALGRQWQCGTIQLDYQLPSAERLNAQYVGQDNRLHHPVMLHRAVLGSLERFMGILIENYAGLFPAWLAFEQAAVVPVSVDFNGYADEVCNALCKAGLRAVSYTNDDNMKSKIKVISAEHKTPYILVVGEREKAAGTATVRYRADSGKGQETMGIASFIEYALDKVKGHYNGI